MHLGFKRKINKGNILAVNISHSYQDCDLGMYIQNKTCNLIIYSKPGSCKKKNIVNIGK